nr:hypothetical protein [uncultured Draconibacterium sp.]
MTIENIKAGSTGYDIALLPKDKINIKVSGEKMSYTGKGAGKNIFLFQTAQENTLRQYQLAKNNREMPPNDFLKYAKEFRTNSYKNSPFKEEFILIIDF